MTKPKKTKKELYFIATRFKNGPIKVSFYTKDWSQEVPRELVEKRKTSTGEIKLYAAI